MKLLKLEGPTRRQFLWMTAVATTSLSSLKGRSREPETEGPPIPCAVVGVGSQGRKILAALSRMERAPVKAYCDVYEPYLRRGRQLAPEARAFRDYSQMLKEVPEVQALFVATPTHLHREVVEAALALRKHVYCEAPLASTLEDSRIIARAAQQTESIFAVGLQNRANPVFKHASKFLRARATGTPVTEEGHWYTNNSWRRPVSDPDFESILNWKLSADTSLGLLGEAGVHTFDNSLRYRQDLPKAVTALGSIMKWNDGRTVPDTVFCIFEYPNGFLSRFEATLANSFREKYYLLNGTEGTILIENTRSWWFKEADAQSLGWEVYASREKIGNEEGIVLLANATKLLEQGLIPAEHSNDQADPEEDPLYEALQDFLNSITDGTTPAGGYKEGYQSAVMAIKAHEALMAGKRVQIERTLFDI